ncbi:MAG: Rne/Rng family ribonuclease, partial [Candidatus Sulfotelmatobacter sp.]
EYTLAGSIYKGRVTRVLPGMQSAFVDIGLERDAFLYVSDFMELEEHDEDVTDVIPAERGVRDLRPQFARSESPAANPEAHAQKDGLEQTAETGQVFLPSEEAETQFETGPASVSAGAAPESSAGDDSQSRDRGGWRGRRRRRGGRRDGRERGPERGPGLGPERGSERGPERSAEPRFTRPAENVPSRSHESGRTQSFGPPAGYQPILLPGESISKYQHLSQPPLQDPHAVAPIESAPETKPVSHAATLPQAEPVLAAAPPVAEPWREKPDASGAERDEQAEAASFPRWEREYRQPEPTSPVAAVGAAAARAAEEDAPRDEYTPVTEHTDLAALPNEASAAGLAPDAHTMEEETIDEEEADTVRYGDHDSEEEEDESGFEEFEEETRAAGDRTYDSAHEASAPSENAPSGTSVPSAEVTNAGAAEPATEETEEENGEELELEEAQAEAEALLDAEARGNGTVDARVEVRAPAGTAGYTQRAPRPGYDRRPQRGRRGGRRFPRREQQDVPKISDLLKEGQEILVQIAKEPIGKKGARITSHIALPGRFLVYMPTVNHTGVSRKIASDEERQRLKRIVMSERDNGHGGFIVRTAAQSASEEELRADIRFLKGLWNDIKTRSESSKPPALIYHDLNVVERVLRDQVTSDFSVIWVDTEPEYERILRFFNRFQPALMKRVKLYTKETPLFEQFGLNEEMNKALKSKVWLKSGGYIVINQTEALVAIDINTGKYVGKTTRLEDTIVKTNVDAIKEIVRQIRLRDLGGIIIIDFIDMDERRNRQRVMQALEEELRHDRAPSKVLQFNDFGLVAITRKRVKQSLERTIGAPCPYCASTGYVKSVTTVCNEIYVEMRKIAKHLEHEDVMLRVNPEVAKELKGNGGRLLNEMEELTKRTIIVKSDPALHQEQFDIN